MSKKKICLIVAVLALGLIAVLGLVVAGTVAPPVGDDSVWFLKRHAMSLVVGIALSVLAAQIPWRLWLKAAVPLFVLWCAAFVASAAFHPVDGRCRYLPIGSLQIDLWTLAWPAAGLLLAWVRTKISLGSRWLLSVGALAIMCCATVVKVLETPNWTARVQELAGIAEPATNVVSEAHCRVFGQELLYEAYQSSKWIGRNDDVSGVTVQHGHTSGVSSAMALRFGKVFPIGVLVLFGIVLGALGLIGRWTRDAAGRVLVFIYGLWLCVPAAYNLAECDKIVPCFGLGVPLVSFGVTSVLVACIGYGVVWSIVREDDSALPEGRRMQ